MIQLLSLLSILFFFVGIDIIQGFPLPLPTASAPRSSTTFLLQANNNLDDAAMSNSGQQLTRRQIGELSFAAVGLTASFLGTRENTPEEYGLWGILPVGPYKRKKTIMETIVPDTIWTFDQKVCVCVCLSVYFALPIYIASILVESLVVTITTLDVLT